MDQMLEQLTRIMPAPKKPIATSGD